MQPTIKKMLKALAEYSPFDRFQLPQVRKPGPFEIGLALLLFVSGILFFTNQNTPTAIETIAPQWLQYSWYGLLTIGGLTTLVGVHWPSRFRGVLIEQAGMLFMAGGSAIYAFSIGYVFGWQGYFGVASWGVFTAAELWRWNQIRIDLKRYKEISQSPMTAKVVVVPEDKR